MATKLLTLRVEESLANEWRLAASVSGCSLSAWIRSTLNASLGEGLEPELKSVAVESSVSSKEVPGFAIPNQKPPVSDADLAYRAAGGGVFSLFCEHGGVRSNCKECS